jgi:uncharacterized protein YjbI with pentapeptide repeats
VTRSPEGPPTIRGVLTGIAIAVAVLIALLLVIGVLPSLIVEWDLDRKADQLQPAELADANNSVRTTLLQAVGGLVLVAGAIATWRQVRLGRDQLLKSEKQNREQLGLSREGQIAERFTRAIDQLGNRESLDVRLGGIYALERIAKDSNTDHGPVMEVLTAFVRRNAKRTPNPEESSGPRNSEEPISFPVDVQAALSVIGRRNAAQDQRTLVLIGTDLRSADLVGANLQANLGDADLRGAVLSDADLRGAVLSDADLQRAVLSGANLQMANLHRANLQMADLNDADLQMANLNDADLQRALLGANLQDAYLHRANLQGANLHGANLQGANLHGANLQGANLLGANLQDAYLQEANLRGAVLSGANLKRARASLGTVWPDGFDEKTAGVVLESDVL